MADTDNQIKSDSKTPAEQPGLIAQTVTSVGLLLHSVNATARMVALTATTLEYGLETVLATHVVARSEEAQKQVDTLKELMLPE